MLPALNPLERLRDHGLFLFRVVVGGSMLFYSLAELQVGAKAWADVAALLRIFGAGAGAQLGGLAVILFVLLCGALLVLGLWTRWAALLLGSALLVVALLRWPQIQSGTLDAAARVFYPASLTAGLWSLAATGGGRFGLDGVYRARRKAKLKSRRGGG